MQLLTLLPLALAALASAQEANTTTSSVPYSNAATTLLTQTDSNGVVTGQPTQPQVITSQPALATSQAPVAIVPAGFTSGTTTVTAGNSTYTVAVMDGQTSLVRSTPTPTTQNTASAASGSGGSKASGSASASSSSGAAAGTHIKAGMGALAAAGGIFAIFL